MLSDQTLVVVFLRGGADTVNLLIPSGDSDYRRHRPTLAVERPLQLTDFYAAHPAFAPLLPAWRAGELAFVQGVGLDDASGSHFETQDRLEQAAPPGGQSLGGGWAGRALRQLGAGPLAGLAVGERVPMSLRGAPALASFTSLSELALPRSPAGASGMATALKALYADEPSVLGQRAGDTLATVERLASISATHRSPLPYPEGAFGRSLADLAAVLRAGVGVRVACVDLANWDTHFVQPALFTGLVGQLAQGLAAFRADLEAARERVTVVVVTEFGRRLYENASGGTDHGRGFAALALGRVRSGVHGEWPGFEADELPGPGGLKVTIDVRTLLRDAAVSTLGIDPQGVFPGLSTPSLGVFVA